MQFRSVAEGLFFYEIFPDFFISGVKLFVMIYVLLVHVLHIGSCFKKAVRVIWAKISVDKRMNMRMRTDRKISSHISKPLIKGGLT
jgi:hypothetical protein